MDHENFLFLKIITIIDVFPPKKVSENEGTELN